MTKRKTVKSDENGLKAVTDTVKMCKKYGISKFEFNGLKLEFETVQPTKSVEQTPYNKISTTSEYVPGPMPSTDDTTERNRELDISELMLTDPEGYEEYILRESDAATRPSTSQ